LNIKDKFVLCWITIWRCIQKFPDGVDNET